MIVNNRTSVTQCQSKKVYKVDNKMKMLRVVFLFAISSATALKLAIQVRGSSPILTNTDIAKKSCGTPLKPDPYHIKKAVSWSANLIKSPAKQSESLEKDGGKTLKPALKRVSASAPDALMIRACGCSTRNSSSSSGASSSGLLVGSKRKSADSVEMTDTTTTAIAETSSSAGAHDDQELRERNKRSSGSMAKPIEVENGELRVRLDCLNC